MCNDESLIDLEEYPYKDEMVIDLKEFESDGLIEINDNKIKVLPLGKKFIRNIAMIFDFHSREKMVTEKFSKTI